MSSYSEGQTHQLMNALEAKDFTPAEITLLGQYPQLIDIKALLHGLAQIVVTKHIVDLDANPFVPDGWKVEEHIRGGKLEFDPTKISLYLSERKKDGRWIIGHDLRKELQGQPVFNANLLDWYLKNPQFIPEEWKGKYTYFWGTIYRSSYGDLCVRYLYWDGQQWNWNYYYLGSYFNDGNPAAVCK